MIGKHIKKKLNLRDRYYNVNKNTSLGGVSKLNIKNKKKAQYFLNSQRTYTLHKRRVKKIQTKPVIVNGPNAQYQSDIIDMKKHSKYNDNYKYILNIIDVFTKYGYSIPMKTKSSRETAESFEQVLKHNKPETLQVDRDKAYLGKSFQEMLKRYKIKMFHSNTHLKSSVVERWNQTLLNTIYKSFTAKNTQTWYKILPTIVKTYNNTIHSTTKFKPKDINRENYELAWINTHSKPIKSKSPKYKIGDIVRISRYKNVFAKGYRPNFSEELFIIDIVNKGKPPTYILKDLNGAKIQGQFYEQELAKYNYKGEQEPFIIDSILKEKGNKYFVSWKGYNSDFNSWVLKSAVQKI